MAEANGRRDTVKVSAARGGFSESCGGDNSPASVNRWSSLPEQICCKTGRTQRGDVVFLKRSGNRSDGVNSPFKVEGGGWASKKTERVAVKSDLPQLESAAGSAE